MKYIIAIIYIVLFPLILWSSTTKAVDPYTLDFESLPEGYTTIESSLSEKGITFGSPSVSLNTSGINGSIIGVRVRNNSSFARSGSQYGVNCTTGIDCEFPSDAILMEFITVQASVSFYVYGAAGYGLPGGAPVGTRFRIYKYDEVGNLTLISSPLLLSSWQEVTITNAKGIIIDTDDTPAIGNAAYSYYVDDITFDDEGGLIDNTPPTANFISPTSNETLTDLPISISIQADDASGIANINGSMRINPDDGSSVSEFNCTGCGVQNNAFPITRTFDINSFSTTAGNITFLDNGSYTITATITDYAGNSTTITRTFILDLAKILAFKVEVNQAVQPQLFDIGPIGTTTPYVPDPEVDVPIVPNKATLVRFYLFSDDTTPSSNFSASLKLKTFDENAVETGTTIIDPNTNQPQVLATIPSDPLFEQEREDAMLAMRIDMERTLNFVIPPELLDFDTDEIELQLVDVNGSAITGITRVDLSKPVQFGISYVNIVNRTAGNEDFIRDRIRGYVRATYPVSELLDDQYLELVVRPKRFFGTQASRWRRGLETIVSMYKLVRSGSYSLRATILLPDIFDQASLEPYDFTYPGIRTILGVATGIGGGNGMKSKRNWSVAVTPALGCLAAHEIGHTIGFPHAGRAHDECGGGGCETFPNINGSLFAEGGLYSDFGIALQLNTTNNTWESTLIDPCPVNDLGKRVPCDADVLTNNGDQPDRPFDFMSYAVPQPEGSLWNLQGNPLPSEINATDRLWVSTINYKRIYNKIVTGRRRNNVLELKNNQPPSIQDVLLVSGVKTDTGGVEILSILSTQAEEPLLSAYNAENIGDYKFEVFDDQDQLLHTQFFKLDTVQDVPTDTYFEFYVYFPYFEDYNRLKITAPDNIVLCNEQTSANKPQAEIMDVGGGQRFTDGMIALDWLTSDADGQKLTYLLEYSPDMGESWQPLGFFEDTIFQNIEIGISSLVPGDYSLFKLTTSDGLLSSSAVTPQTFCVGGDGNCDALPVQLSNGEVEVVLDDPNSQLQPQALAFREATTTKASVTYGDSDLILANEETISSADIRVRTEGVINFEPTDDVILDADDNIVFQTAQGNKSRMLINETGAVGVGTENPKTLLDVNGSLSLTSEESEIRFYSDNTVTGSIIQGANTILNILNLTSGDINFYTDSGNRLALQLDAVGVAHFPDFMRLGDNKDGATWQLGVTGQSIFRGYTNIREAPLQITQVNNSTFNTDNGIRFTSSTATGTWRIMHSGQFLSFVLDDIRKAYIDTDGNYVTTSDRALKNEIKPSNDVLSKVLALRPVTYRYKNAVAEKYDVGFIAQEVQELFPEAVIKDEEGYLGVIYDHFNVLAIQAVKEQNLLVAESGNRLDAAEADTDDLENRLAQLEVLLSQNTLTPATVDLQGPDQPRLEQNRPNPFRSETQIRYYLPPTAESAQLRITNANGEILKILELQDSGEGLVTIKTSNLPSGSYQYTLVIDGKVFTTKQMILTKN